MTEASASTKLGLTEGGRNILSLVIFVHLFCVVVGLFGNESLSLIADRLRGVLAPYTRLLNLDPQFGVGFQLTHAMEYEDDHQLVLQRAGQPELALRPLPAAGSWGAGRGFQGQRWQALGQRLGMFVANEADQAVAELARSVAAALPMDETSQLRLECRRFQPPPLEGSDATSRGANAAWQTVYSADLVRDARGLVRVHKQIETGEAAQVRKRP
jgi:hypothetical protein